MPCRLGDGWGGEGALGLEPLDHRLLGQQKSMGNFHTGGSGPRWERGGGACNQYFEVQEGFLEEAPNSAPKV